MNRTTTISVALILLAAAAPAASASDGEAENNAVWVSTGCKDSNAAGNGGASGLAGAEEDVIEGGEDDAGVGASASPQLISVTVDLPQGFGTAETLVQLVEGLAIEGGSAGDGGVNPCDGRRGYVEVFAKVDGDGRHVCFDGDANVFQNCDNNAPELI